MNEQVADWIDVDESKYNQVKQAYSALDSRSVLIEMSMSPYDVPLQLRGDYDEDTKRFVIEFKYIDAEDSRTLKLDDHISAVVGVGSGRIYSLHVDLEALGAQSVQVTIVEKVHEDAEFALTRMANPTGIAGAKSKSNAKNYNVLQKIITDNWPELRRELLSAQ